MKLLWLDLETTGLDAKEHRILEVATFTTELETPFTCSSAKLQWVLPFVPKYQPRAWDRTDAFVRNMHTKNGLLEECLISSVDYREVEREILSLIPLKKDVGHEDLTALAGSSVHFDLGFLRECMPELAANLSHRVYDVSAVKLFCQSLGMPKLPRAEAHRALADVEESVAHAKACAEWLTAP